MNGFERIGIIIVKILVILHKRKYTVYYILTEFELLWIILKHFA